MIYQDAKHFIKTGDIILSSGNSAFSKLIKEATGIKWSHVAVAVWGDDFDLVPKPEYKDRLFVWEATGRGVGEVEFEKASVTPGVTFLSKLVNWGAGEVAFRRLDTRVLDLAGFRYHCQQYRGFPYEHDKFEMLKAVRWVRAIPGLSANVQALATQFCWECVAAAYQTMELLPMDPPANTYSNVDFAGDDLPLLHGAKLGPIIPIEF